MFWNLWKFFAAFVKRNSVGFCKRDVGFFFKRHLGFWEKIGKPCSVISKFLNNHSMKSFIQKKNPEFSKDRKIDFFRNDGKIFLSLPKKSFCHFLLKIGKKVFSWIILNSNFRNKKQQRFLNPRLNVTHISKFFLISVLKNVWISKKFGRFQNVPTSKCLEKKNFRYIFIFPIERTVKNLIKTFFNEKWRICTFWESRNFNRIFSESMSCFERFYKKSIFLKILMKNFPKNFWESFKIFSLVKESQEYFDNQTYF